MILSKIAGSQLTILVDGETVRQNSHSSGEQCSGELAITPPFLGASQTLLNADHHKVYFQVALPKTEAIRASASSL